MATEDKYLKKIEKLSKENEELKRKNSNLKDKISKQKEKYEFKISQLKKKLEANHVIDKPFKYVLDKYPEIIDKIFKILNKHNVQFINRKELGKRIILLLEGDDIQKPLFSKAKLNSYLDLVNSFSLQEYRQIKFAPIIKSDKALFENYEQIVRVLKPLRKQEKSKNEFEFTNFSSKDVTIAEYDEDEDEELDTTNVYKI